MGCALIFGVRNPEKLTTVNTPKDNRPNNTMDNCSSVITPLLERYYLSPMYGLEFTFGFIGNLFVVLGYIFCLPAWKSTNVYLFNLSMSDLIFLCTLPELSYNYTFNLKKFNSSLCVINLYILNVNMYSSILFMMWVSVDQFLLLCHPQREHILLTLKASLCISILNWIWVTIQIAPLIVFIIRDSEQNGWTVCRDFGSLGEARAILIYTLVLTITGYVLPLLALFLSSQRMVSVLMKREEMRGTSYQRPVRIMRSAAIMFLVLYTPIHVMRLVHIASRLPRLNFSHCIMDYINAFYTVTRPIAYVHSVINPVFYFLMTDSFKKALQDKWTQLKRMLKSRGVERSLEGQVLQLKKGHTGQDARTPTTANCIIYYDYTLEELDIYQNVWL